MSGLPPAGTLDATFRAYAGHLPPQFREHAATLPHRLGLTPARSGRFDDFWVLAINRDLPGYAAEDPSRPGEPLVPAWALERFRAAHHCAVVHCLIADRVVDRQVAPDLRLLVLRDLFLRLWEHELSEGMGDVRRGRAALAAALAALRKGTRLELRSMERRTLDAATYALQTRDKLRWGSAAAAGLLRRAGHEGRAELLERSYDRFCFALQCLDDALDREEDEQTRGVSVPAVLDLPDGALVRAVPPVLDAAIAVAEQGGFGRMADWMRSFRRLASRIDPGGDAALDARLGRRLAAGALEVL